MELKEWLARKLLNVGACGEWEAHSPEYRKFLLEQAECIIAKLNKAGYGREAIQEGDKYIDWKPISPDDIAKI